MSGDPITHQQLAAQVTEMVAIAADENLVGTEDGPRVDRWGRELEDAVDRGLEAAQDRENGVAA